ncbi:MAG TPA: hypothetical protein VH601_16000 [Bryobacteraceae bacterium]|jgi:hypothetical protein
MIKKMLTGFLTVGVAAVIAATGSYKVDLFQNSILNGKQLKAGTYRIDVANNTATLTQGKTTVQAPAREETMPNKFANTQMVYTNNNLQEIDIGGTHTKIVFAAEGQPGA